MKPRTAYRCTCGHWSHANHTLAAQAKHLGHRMLCIPSMALRRLRHRWDNRGVQAIIADVEAAERRERKHKFVSDYY